MTNEHCTTTSNNDNDNENDTTRMGGYYLGIDVGTQGLTALLVEADASLTVVASGEASYECIPNLETGCYEQNAKDWETALIGALNEIHNKLGIQPPPPPPPVSSSTTSTSSSSSSSAAATFRNNKKVLAVCVAGQMHGQVMVNSDGNVIGTVRLWCDARNEEEGDFLTKELFQGMVKIPKRATVARWLWTIKNQPDLARQCSYLTTPAGWITYILTGKSCMALGIGDASGMFPIDTTTFTYRQDLLKTFDAYVDDTYNNNTNDHADDRNFPRLSDILPEVLVAGQISGRMDSKFWSTSDLLPQGTLVAPAEGDQPASLAGSLIGETGMISCSFGTSVVANMVMPSSSLRVSTTGTPSTRTGGDGSADGGNDKDVGTIPAALMLPSSSSSTNTTTISPAVDHFCAVNGQPINMVWLRNGTTFMNTIASSFGGGGNNNNNHTTTMGQLMADAIQVPPDCGGLIALPFMDDEPGLDVQRGGTAMMIGYNAQNNTPGHVMKAALVSTMFNLYLGTSKVDGQGVEQQSPPTSLVGGEGMQKQQQEQHQHQQQPIVLTGGLSKTPETGQILADIFDRPVKLLESSDEGCAWGAATLAQYAWRCNNNNSERHGLHGSLDGDGNNSNSRQQQQPPPPPEQVGWPTYLASIHLQPQHEFLPIRDNVVEYREVLQKYQRLLELQPMLDKIMTGR